MKPDHDVRWAIDGVLARGRRPGYFEHGSVPKPVVDLWIADVKALGVESIICLLGDDQLPLYASLETDLVSYYRAAGFAVAHVPARDHQTPPLSCEHFKVIGEAFEVLPKPVLVHCSAGIDRTGRAVEYLKAVLIAK
jgi:protein tyrosine phosphatase (PTP) superfamily phosphohydrolase (DUF442 family)